MFQHPSGQNIFPFIRSQQSLTIDQERFAHKASARMVHLSGTVAASRILTLYRRAVLSSLLHQPIYRPQHLWDDTRGCDEYHLGDNAENCQLRLDDEDHQSEYQET